MTPTSKGGQPVKYRAANLDTQVFTELRRRAGAMSAKDGKYHGINDAVRELLGYPPLTKYRKKNG